MAVADIPLQVIAREHVWVIKGEKWYGYFSMLEKAWM